MCNENLIVFNISTRTSLSVTKFVLESGTVLFRYLDNAALKAFARVPLWGEIKWLPTIRIHKATHASSGREQMLTHIEDT